LESEIFEEFTMKKSALFVLLLVMASITVKADVLLMDAIAAAPPNSSSGVIRPQRGATMPEVFAAFGEPEQTREAIGEPPITRWVYPKYTVYFEYQSVIDVVLHRQ
jgi:hypothetical protein